MTKYTMNLADALLERVRSELLAGLNFGVEVEGSIDISGEADIEEKIAEHLQPAVEALRKALRIAEFARLDIDHFMWEECLFFADDNGEVRMASFSDLKRAWRPLPPGPAYKLELLPPEDVEIPSIVNPNEGPIQ